MKRFEHWKFRVRHTQQFRQCEYFLEGDFVRFRVELAPLSVRQ